MRGKLLAACAVAMACACGSANAATLAVSGSGSLVDWNAGGALLPYTFSATSTDMTIQNWNGGSQAYFLGDLNLSLTINGVQYEADGPGRFYLQRDGTFIVGVNGADFAFGAESIAGRPDAGHVSTSATGLYLFGGDYGTFSLSEMPNFSVPEPSTWALSILGLCLLGAALRRSPRYGWAPVQP